MEFQYVVDLINKMNFMTDALPPWADSYCTPPKFNMEPEHDGFQKESPFPGVDFQVPC